MDWQTWFSGLLGAFGLLEISVSARWVVGLASTSLVWVGGELWKSISGSRSKIYYIVACILLLLVVLALLAPFFLNKPVAPPTDSVIMACDSVHENGQRYKRGDTVLLLKDVNTRILDSEDKFKTDKPFRDERIFGSDEIYRFEWTKSDTSKEYQFDTKIGPICDWKKIPLSAIQLKPIPSQPSKKRPILCGIRISDASSERFVISVGRRILASNQQPSGPSRLMRQVRCPDGSIDYTYLSDQDYKRYLENKADPNSRPSRPPVRPQGPPPPNVLTSNSSDPIGNAVSQQVPSNTSGAANNSTSVGP